MGQSVGHGTKGVGHVLHGSHAASDAPHRVQFHESVLHVEESRGVIHGLLLEVRVRSRDDGQDMAIDVSGWDAVVGDGSGDEVAQYGGGTRSVQHQFRQQLQQDVEPALNVLLEKDAVVEVADHDGRHLAVRGLLLHGHGDGHDQHLVLLLVQVQLLQCIDHLLRVPVLEVLGDDGRDELLDLVLIQRRGNGLELEVLLRVRVVVRVMGILFRLLDSDQFAPRDSPCPFSARASCSG